jgi:hypothetical protein
MGGDARICRRQRARRLKGHQSQEKGKRDGSHFAAAERGSLRSRAAQIRIALRLVPCPEVVEDPELLVVIRD